MPQPQTLGVQNAQLLQGIGDQYISALGIAQQRRTAIEEMQMRRQLAAQQTASRFAEMFAGAQMQAARDARLNEFDQQRLKQQQDAQQYKTDAEAMGRDPSQVFIEAGGDKDEYFKLRNTYAAQKQQADQEMEFQQKRKFLLDAKQGELDWQQEQARKRVKERAEWFGQWSSDPANKPYAQEMQGRILQADLKDTLGISMPQPVTGQSEWDQGKVTENGNVIGSVVGGKFVYANRGRSGASQAPVEEMEPITAKEVDDYLDSHWKRRAAVGEKDSLKETAGAGSSLVAKTSADASNEDRTWAEDQLTQTRISQSLQMDRIKKIKAVMAQGGVSYEKAKELVDKGEQDADSNVRIQDFNATTQKYSASGAAAISRGEVPTFSPAPSAVTQPAPTEEVTQQAVDEKTGEVVTFVLRNGQWQRR